VLRSIVSIVCAAFVVAACGRQEQAAPPAVAPPPVAVPAPVEQPLPFGITGVELGRAIGADNRVLAPATSFAPTDTIYASIATGGEARGMVVAARWSYEDGQTVAESSETVESAAPTVVAFHIAKPDGWPTGRYRVDVTADGRPAATREFEVR